MRYQHQIGHKEYFFLADAALNTAADLLSNIIKDQEPQFNILQDGKLLQVGWNYFRVSKKEGQYQLLAPDYTHNPFEDTTVDLSQALTYFKEQSKAISHAGIQPLETTFQDTLIVETGALSADRIYMIRDTAPENGDSGWTCTSVFFSGPSSLEDYAKAYTYQLRRFCEQAISILHFPVGTIAVFEKGRLIEAVGENNKKLL